MEPTIPSKMLEILVIGLFEVGRYTSWRQPTEKDMEEGSFAFCLLALTLTGKFIFPVSVDGIPTQAEDQ